MIFIMFFLAYEKTILSLKSHKLQRLPVLSPGCVHDSTQSHLYFIKSLFVVRERPVALQPRNLIYTVK